MDETHAFDFGFDPQADRKPFDGNRFLIEMAIIEGDDPGPTMRWIRAIAGFTLEAAAEKMGITAGKLLDYERQEVKPQWKTVFKFAEAIGVTGSTCPMCEQQKPVDPVTNHLHPGC